MSECGQENENESLVNWFVWALDYQFHYVHATDDDEHKRGGERNQGTTMKKMSRKININK